VLGPFSRQIISITSALVVIVALSHGLKWNTLMVAGWDIYVIVLLGLEWLAIATTHPRQDHKIARRLDTHRNVIFVVVIVAAFASLFAILFLFIGHEKLSPATLGMHTGLSLLAIILSWLLIQTTFALHYAHVYYREPDEKSSDVEEGGHGLAFPNEENPDYLDFAYFSFGVGMTFQVADVQVTSTPVRGLVLLQSLLSFSYNVIIIALTINIVSGLFSG
jgi:uncharacterized membrane protein